MSVGDESLHEPIAPGTRVEVRTGFDRTWAKGFEVDEVVDHGYRVRRRSDHTVLPTTFPAERVREERRSSMWWI